MKKYTDIKKTYLFLTIILVITFSSCENIIDIDSPDFQLESSTIFNNPATANAAIEGIYAKLENEIYSADMPRIANTELASRTVFPSFPDALTSSFIDFEADPLNPDIAAVWKSYYSVIYLANAALEGLESQTYSSKNRLRGEALFMRALMHYYLVNLYGDVPLITTTAITETATKPRTLVAEVNAQIIADLLEAQSLLPEDYSEYGGLKVRANKWAAKALLARVYLSVENWSGAETMASEVINSGLFSLVALNQTFKIGSNEMILQFKPVANGGSQNRGFIIAAISPSFGFSLFQLTEDFLNSFEPNDSRKDVWISATPDPFGPTIFEGNKITVFTFEGTPPEYEPVLRLSEMYMIRAEARNYLNNISGARSDLNVIRNRAGLPNTTAATFNQLFLAIEMERHHEFFLEEGHRWFDLKRTNRIDDVLGAGVSTYQTTDNLWPIPAIEREANPNLTQNPGYN